MGNYKVIKENEKYTIGEYDKGYKAVIINDGIYGYYYWDTEEEAQKAATAYNEYEGCEWLGNHWAGKDIMWDDEIHEFDTEMVELYRLFDAIKEE